MTRRIVSVALLLGGVMVIQGAPRSSAQVISCITLQGTHFFTNQPTLVPKGCILTHRKPAETTGLSIVPAPSAEVPQSTQAILRNAERQRAQTKQLARELLQEAQKISQQYEETSANVFRTNLVRTRLEYRQELEEIKNDRDKLLQNLSDSELPDTDQESIKEVLRGIPG